MLGSLAVEATRRHTDESRGAEERNIKIEGSSHDRARTIRVASTLLSVIIAASATPAAAQESRRVVTLDEALKAADLIPDLEAARAALRMAQAEVRAASRPPDPTISFARRSITAKESYGLSVPLPWPGRSARISSARAGVDIAVAERDLARSVARKAMRLAWFTLAARQDMALGAHDRAARLQKTADALQELLDAGRIALVDSSRGKADAALAAAAVVRADEDTLIAEGVLRRLLTIDATQHIAVERANAIPAEERPLEQVTSLAISRSPRALAADARIKAADASLRLAEALRLPGVSIDVGADCNDPTQPGTDHSIGVSLTVPLSASPAIAVARAERDRAIALRDQVKREIADAVEEAWRGSRAEKARYDALLNQALPAATQAADLAQIAYREGRSDVFRLLDAERTLAEVRSGLAEAYLAWGTSYAELLSVIGEEER